MATDRDWYWQHGMCPDCEREVERHGDIFDRHCPHCDEDTTEDRAREGGEPPWRGREKADYDAHVQDRIQQELKR